MSKTKNRAGQRKAGRARPNLRSRNELESGGRVQHPPVDPMQREANRIGLPYPEKIELTPFGRGQFRDDPNLRGLECIDRVVRVPLSPNTPVRQIAIALRGDTGTLLGNITLYPDGLPGYFKAGEYIIQVHPEHRRRGYGMVLLRIMDSYFPINFMTQHYTAAGRALAAKHLSGKDNRNRQAESQSGLNGAR